MQKKHIYAVHDTARISHRVNTMHTCEVKHCHWEESLLLLVGHVFAEINKFNLTQHFAVVRRIDSVTFVQKVNVESAMLDKRKNGCKKLASWQQNLCFHLGCLIFLSFHSSSFVLWHIMGDPSLIVGWNVIEKHSCSSPTVLTAAHGSANMRTFVLQ